ncbi:hypothetical protein GCAAIG_11300 [Candidatus Electronema halotolerans]
MNIFTAAITGLTIVIKKIGIAFKAVLTGLKIVITAIINTIVSAIKWAWTQFVNVIHWLFRTYLRFEAGCVPPVQKLVGLLIRMRWGFVIISGLYAVYKYFGITYLLVSMVVCVGLVWIGYSQAEEEEEKWNLFFDKINEIISEYLKYLIRLSIIIFSVYFSVYFLCKFNLIYELAVTVFWIYIGVALFWPFIQCYIPYEYRNLIEAINDVIVVIFIICGVISIIYRSYCYLRHIWTVHFN